MGNPSSQRSLAPRQRSHAPLRPLSDGTNRESPVRLLDAFTSLFQDLADLAARSPFSQLAQRLIYAVAPGQDVCVVVPFDLHGVMLPAGKADGVPAFRPVPHSWKTHRRGDALQSADASKVK